MKTIHAEIIIQTSVPQVWALLGDPTAASRYVPGVVQARFDGTHRVCVLANGAEIHEHLTFNPEQHALTYRHVKTPMPVRHSAGAFRVRPEGDCSRVEVTAELEANSADMEPALAAMMSEGLKATLQNLKLLAERAG
ncbi:MAG: SRPBCC family protein [Opitutae bacterium]|nr:SRPBCC family protein [Opitutae bacterium]